MGSQTPILYPLFWPFLLQTKIMGSVWHVTQSLCCVRQICIWDTEGATIPNLTTQRFWTKYESWKSFSFASAVRQPSFSLVVCVIAGYGHIAPKTFWGKIVTMIYAVFGIPICVLTLTNIGGFMATAFRFIYHKVCKLYLHIYQPPWMFYRIHGKTFLWVRCVKLGHYTSCVCIKQK